jgi:hypothetical protein
LESAVIGTRKLIGRIGGIGISFNDERMLKDGIAEARNLRVNRPSACRRELFGPMRSGLKESAGSQPRAATMSISEKLVASIFIWRNAL